MDEGVEADDGDADAEASDEAEYDGEAAFAQPEYGETDDDDDGAPKPEPPALPCLRLGIAIDEDMIRRRMLRDAAVYNDVSLKDE